MDIEFRHLAYFQAIAQEESFNRGAARLHISQPTLSRQMSALECYLDVKLFERSRSGVTLTDAGRHFLAKATKLLEAKQELLDSMRSGPIERLRIGYLAPSLFGRVGEAIHSFRQQWPELEIQITESSPRRQIELLSRSQIDIAFLGHSESDLPENLELLPLYSLPLVAVLPVTHPLAKESKIDLLSLKEERFLGLKEELFPGRQAIVSGACLKAGFDIRFSDLADSLISLLVLVGHGQGVTLIPQDSLAIAHPQVVFVPLAGENPAICFHSAIRSDEERPMIRDLLDLIRESRPA
jgi:LysR family transcriptional regulator, benzoate and cis,cis-muconate-responsive activator of ben and cat genes